MHGLLIVDKPRGVTSHDVVAAVRRAAGTRKVGHAGTLDPLATGVLVLALGTATRTLEYLLADDKWYDAEITLGQATDTYDAEGQIVHRHAGTLPARDEVEQALDAFRGPILQRPPLFSALKQDGEALYKKARRGEVVEVAPREVTIHALTLTDWAPPRLGLRVHCSKGTYIRSLAHELGERLTVGAHLSGLRRLSSGEFTLAQAQTLAAIREATRDQLRAWLLPVGTGLSTIPALVVDEAQQQAIRHGQSLPADDGEGLARAVDPSGRLIAMMEWRADRGWQPRKVFA